MTALLALIFALLALLAPGDNTPEPTPVPDVQIADAVSITREPSAPVWDITDARSILRESIPEGYRSANVIDAR